MTTLQIKAPGVCTDRTLPILNPLWTPLLLANPRMWVDCDLSPVVVDGSNNVSSITDLAQGKAFTASGLARPTRTGSMNGKTALVFDGDAFLKAYELGGGADYHCFFVCMNVGTIANVQQTIFMHGTGNPQTSLNSLNEVRAYDGSGAPLSSPIPGPGNLLITFFRDGADNLNKLRINGVQVSSANITAPVNMSGDCRIGAYTDTTGFLTNSQIGAVGISTGIQSLLDVQKLEGYLAQRFISNTFLPLEHPYRSTPPRKNS